ncbi:MAG: tetratricopeptide repeat protein [Thermoanaerobaculia bacterium]
MNRLAAAGLLVACLTATLAAEIPPAPDLSHLEPGVRAQLEEALEAVREVDAAGSASPHEVAAAWGRLGELYYLYDLSSAASTALAEAKRLEPEEFRWVYLLGILERLEGEHGAAVASFERAAELDPDYAPVWVRLGEVCLELGRHEDAERSYRHALDLDETLAAAWEGLGRLASDRGDPAAAVQCFERALELQPRASSLHHPLGLAYRALGDLEAARTHLAANRGDRVRIPDPLLRELSGLVTSNQADFKAGVQAMRHGNAELALERFDRALAELPDDPLVPYNIALAHQQLGHREETERWLRRSLELDPEFRNGHYNLASLLAADGRLPEAEEHFRRAHEIDPTDTASHVGWAKVLAAMGQRERALGEIATLLARSPGEPEALTLRGIVQAQQGLQSEAEASFGAAVANGSAEAAFELGLLLEGEGRLQEAEASYRRAAEGSEDPLEAWERLGTLLGRIGRFEEAAEAFGHALEADPDRVQSRIGRALSLLLLDRSDTARVVLEEGLERRPESSALGNMLARVLAAAADPQTRDGARAVEIARGLLDREATLDHAETLAMALAEAGRYDEAVALQERIVRQLPAGSPSERVAIANARLEAFRRGEPVREPWRRGG